MINYKIADLFDNIPSEGSIFIPHVCNDKYVMGSGFVVPLKRHWPIVEREYVLKKPRLGKAQLVQVKGNVGVFNMVAQHGVINPHNPKPIKYLQLAKCMEQVKDEILAIDNNGSIIAPLFGAGLAGGNWDFIEELINEIWIGNKINVTIFQLPSFVVRDPN